MRRSLAALMSGLFLALTVGCGGGGDNGGAQTKTDAGTHPEATVSIPGPLHGEVLPPSALPPAAPPSVTPQNFLPGEVLPPIEDDAPRITKTQKQVALLTEAVLRYIEENKAAPTSLEAMAQPGQGKKPYFAPSLLLDPWGSRIQYDPKGPMNQRKQPDIWSLGPTDGSVFIGNWSEKPTAAPAPAPMPKPVTTTGAILPPTGS